MISKSFDEALYKAFEGAGIRLPKHKQIIMTLADKDKQMVLILHRDLKHLDIRYTLQEELQRFSRKMAYTLFRLIRLDRKHLHFLTFILEHKIDLVIDTPENGIERAKDGFLIRRYAIETGVHCLHKS